MGVIATYAAVTNSQLADFLRNPDRLVAFMVGEHESIHIDKAHEGIDFLLKKLCAKTPRSPILDAAYGGVETEVKIGYGPVRYLLPEEVAAIAKGLSSISSADLSGVYVAKELQKAFLEPDIWGSDWALNYLLEYYEKLTAFYQRAAMEKKAVLQNET